MHQLLSRRFFLATIALYYLLTHGIEEQDQLGSGKMFDSIAPYYDTANTVMSLGQHFYWRRFGIQ